MTYKFTPEEQAFNQAFDETFAIWRDRAIHASIMVRHIIDNLRDLDDDEQLGGNFNPSDDALLAAAVAILPLITTSDWDIDYVF